ncbi:MAG: 3-keto-5-aminohexanoate cleavage protein [Anaerolineaceae bacterium]|nr:3-keto-5-aminohexanoate cleavage protein [Anaerolineaceae bacterium]
MEKLIITAAICGAEVTKEHNPAVPYTISEIAREAKAAVDAGSSIIHLHVREDDGTPTQSEDRFKLAIDAIIDLCPDVIIQPSTGGAVGMSNEQRIAPLNLNPEMATLDCGTINFGGDEIFANSEDTVIEFAKIMQARRVKPEIEVFDRGMVQLAKKLQAKGFFDGNLHFNLVLGTSCGMPAELEDIVYLVNSLPGNSTFTGTGIGRYEFNVACAAMILGGHVRVGFEDNIYLKKGVLARSNGELVEKAVRLSLELGREIATPAEARAILGLNTH